MWKIAVLSHPVAGRRTNYVPKNPVVYWKKKKKKMISLFAFVIIGPHPDKTNKVTVRPAKTQISLGHPPSLIRGFAVRLMDS